MVNGKFMISLGLPDMSNQLARGLGRMTIFCRKPVPVTCFHSCFRAACLASESRGITIDVLILKLIKNNVHRDLAQYVKGPLNPRNQNLPLQLGWKMSV